MSNEVRFEVSTRCNYNCRICPRDQFVREKTTMGLELFKALLDKCWMYKVCTFSGFGEPLLDSTLREKIAYAKSKGFRVILLTNGSLMNKARFLRLKQAGLDSVRVSFYGYGIKSYYENHGISLHYGVAMINILDMIRNKGNVEIHVTGLDSCYNKRWLDLWEDLNIDSIEVWKPHNWVDAFEFRKVTGKRLKSCGRPYFGPLQVQVDGTVNMCCFDFNGRLTIGDLKEETVFEILSGDQCLKIREAHRSGELSNLICDKCDQRNADKSGCLVYSTRGIADREKKTSTTGEIMYG